MSNTRTPQTEISVKTTKVTAGLKADDDAQELINGILATLNLQEAR